MNPQTLADIEEEADRAHEQHGVTSMRHQDVLADRRLSILAEELGEVARVLNDNRHGKIEHPLSHLYGELIQTAAMAADWADQVRGQIT